MSPFEAGKIAKAAGKTSTDNPYIVGYTKLGSPKLSEDGVEWQNGFGSVGRECSKKEMDAARELDVSRFRRKSNRYYTS